MGKDIREERQEEKKTFEQQPREEKKTYVKTTKRRSDYWWAYPLDKRYVFIVFHRRLNIKTYKQGSFILFCVALWGKRCRTCLSVARNVFQYICSWVCFDVIFLWEIVLWMFIKCDLQFEILFHKSLEFEYLIKTW